MSDAWLNTKLMLEKIIFSIGMILTLLFNLAILPVHIIVWLTGHSIWPVVWPKAMKRRLDYYRELYQEMIEGFIYK